MDSSGRISDLEGRLLNMEMERNTFFLQIQNLNVTKQDTEETLQLLRNQVDEVGLLFHGMFEIS